MKDESGLVRRPVRRSAPRAGGRAKREGGRLLVVSVGVLIIAVIAVCVTLHAQDAASEDQAQRYYDSGMQFLGDHKYAEALKDFKSVVERYGSSRVAHKALLEIAKYYVDIEPNLVQAKSSVDLLRDKYALTESAPYGFVLSARIALRTSRAPDSVESALAELARVPRNYPGSDAIPVADFWAGEVLRTTGKYDDALRQYQAVSSGYPQSTWALRSLLGQAQCLVHKGNFSRAMEALQQVRLRRPSSAEARTALAWNTILYRLYVRPPAQPAFEFQGRTIPGPAGRLKDVRALAFTPDDTLIAVTDEAVAGFDATGKPTSAPVVATPRAVALDAGGLPYVAGRGGVMLPGGKFQSLSVPKPDGTPRSLEEIPGLVVDALGQLLVIDRNPKTVARFSRDGKPLAALNTGQVERLALDSCDTIAALSGDGPSVAFMGQDGKQVQRLGPRGAGYEFDKPVDIAFDPFDHLYVLDRGAGTVFVFDPAGRLRTAFTIAQKAPGAFRRASAFALDSAGRLFIADDSAEHVQVYQ